MSSAQSPATEPYFSVSTISVKPGKMGDALKCFAEVADATKNEPGAKWYRFYQVEGKDEIVFIEKFESRTAYSIHTSSAHVKEWAAKYLNAGIFDGSFTFHPLVSNGPPAGGFDRT